MVAAALTAGTVVKVSECNVGHSVRGNEWRHERPLLLLWRVRSQNIASGGAGYIFQSFEKVRDTVREQLPTEPMPNSIHG
jgi:hypothetical protein